MHLKNYAQVRRYYNCGSRVDIHLRRKPNSFPGNSSGVGEYLQVGVRSGDSLVILIEGPSG